MTTLKAALEKRRDRLPDEGFYGFDECLELLLPVVEAMEVIASPGGTQTELEIQTQKAAERVLAKLRADLEVGGG